VATPNIPPTFAFLPFLPAFAFALHWHRKPLYTFPTSHLFPQSILLLQSRIFYHQLFSILISPRINYLFAFHPPLYPSHSAFQYLSFPSLFSYSYLSGINPSCPWFLTSTTTNLPSAFSLDLLPPWPRPVFPRHFRPDLTLIPLVRIVDSNFSTSLNTSFLDKKVVTAHFGLLGFGRRLQPCAPAT
jgi:hypothetical protein